MLHELVHPAKELVCGVDPSSLFANEVWQAFNVFAIGASEWRLTAIAPSSRAKRATRESKPHANALRVRDQLW